MLNNSAASLHHQHDVDTVKIEDKTKPTSMNLIVILLSLVVVALSTYFSIKALKHLRIAQQGFRLRN
jgi:hypothetical protein